MERSIYYIFVALVLGVILIWNDSVLAQYEMSPPNEQSQSLSEDYNPAIQPENFIDVIDNPFFTLQNGKSFTYRARTSDGEERVTTNVTDNRKVIMGVKTMEVVDRVWMNDELVEETFDWFAQDRDGNVWYFGEDSRDMENGRVVSTSGSWEAGVNGAKPGIIMRADPKVGDTYRQEYLRGEAEDMAEVVSVSEAVTVPAGTFSNCLKTRDWSALDPTVQEFKYYCRDVSSVVLEEDPRLSKRLELVSFGL